MKGLTPELCFLRYAFPCAMNKLIAKKITQEEFDRMKEAFEYGLALPREFLERVYTDAIPELKRLADNYWSVKVIREYFRNKHNTTVPAEYPEQYRQLCEVHTGTLESARSGTLFTARLDNGKLRQVDAVYPRPKVGDVVVIHYGYAVELAD